MSSTRAYSLVLSVVAPLSGCSAPCEEIGISRSVAPDKGHAAYVVGRDCGATTDFATVVRIGRRDADQGAAQEIFVADGNHGKAVTFDRGGPVVRLTWLDASHLHITIANGARIFERQVSSGNIAITYGKLIVD